MENNESQFPAQEVELPSKGKLYPKDHPLSKGVISLKVMTAREEDILTNSAFLRKGVAIDKVLQSLIVDKFDYDTLLLCDKNTIFIASRIFAYGKDYEFSYTNEDGDLLRATVDLTSLKDKEIDESLFNERNEFTFTLPYSKAVVIFKLLNHKDKKTIDTEVEGLNKTAGFSTGGVTNTLRRQIVSYNGEKDFGKIATLVNNMLSRDSIALRKYINEVTPGLIFKADIKLTDGATVPQVDIPITPEFFFPGSGL